MTIGYSAGSNVTPVAGSAASVTFNSVNGGTQFPLGATVIAFIGYYAGNRMAISSTGTTIGGQAVTIIDGDPGAFATAPSGNPACCAVYATMPTAQTDTVTIGTTNANNFNGCTVGVVILTGQASSPTAHNHLLNSAAGADPQQPSSAIVLPAGGVGVAALVTTDLAAIPTPNWSTTGNSNITASAGDINSNGSTFHELQLVIGHSVTASTQWRASISGTGTAYNFATSMAVVTWAAGNAAPAWYDNVSGVTSVGRQVIMIGAG